MTTVTAKGGGSPITVPGLGAGRWTFTVVAASANGAGAASNASGPVLITAPPATTSWLASGSTATNVVAVNGAAGNGSTDDYTAIQNAINAAGDAGGGIVHLPAATYLVNNHLQLRNNVRLEGVGSSTVIKAGSGFYNSQAPAGGYPVVTTNGADNVTIANIGLDQSGDVYGDRNMAGRLAGYLCELRNSTNILVTGVTTRNPSSYSIVPIGSTRFSIVHCNTQVATSGRYDQLDGLHVLDSNTGEVRFNTVDQRVGTDGDDGTVAHTINGPVHDVVYANNEVRGGNNGGGMQFAVGNYPIYNITVQDSEFHGCTYGIRTGGYDNANGGVHNVTIQRNNVHDNVPGNAFPGGGPGIDIGDYGMNGPIANITIANNRACNTGQVSTTGGTVTGTLGCGDPSPCQGSLGA